MRESYDNINHKFVVIILIRWSKIFFLRAWIHVPKVPFSVFVKLKNEIRNFMIKFYFFQYEKLK